MTQEVLDKIMEQCDIQLESETVLESLEIGLEGIEHSKEDVERVTKWILRKMSDYLYTELQQQLQNQVE